MEKDDRLLLSICRDRNERIAVLERQLREARAKNKVLEQQIDEIRGETGKKQEQPKEANADGQSEFSCSKEYSKIILAEHHCKSYF